jgi:hypothetical protein
VLDQLKRVVVTRRASHLGPSEKFLSGTSNQQKKYAKLVFVLRLHSSVVEQGTHKPKVESSNLSGAISPIAGANRKIPRQVHLAGDFSMVIQSN